MATTMCSLTHPVIFIFDHSSEEVEIPDYDESAGVSTTSSCISIGAIADVDGDITISLINEYPKTPSIEICDQVLATPNNTISVVTADDTKLLETNTNNKEARVRVLVNNRNHPDNITIVIT